MLGKLTVYHRISQVKNHKHYLGNLKLLFVVSVLEHVATQCQALLDMKYKMQEPLPNGLASFCTKLIIMFNF